MSKLSEYGQELLPWYINKTLSDSEKSKLELLQTNSDSFKKMVADESKFAAQLQREDSELDDILQQQPKAFAALQQRIAADDKKNASPVKKDEAPKVSAKVIKFPFPLAVAAAFLAITIISFSILQFGPEADKSPTDFRTFISPSEYSGKVLQLVFAPTTQAATIDELLNNPAIEVLDGPSANGVYRVHLNDENDLEYWRQLDDVIWAEFEEN